jgi:hypothetical protein
MFLGSTTFFFLSTYSSNTSIVFYLEANGERTPFPKHALDAIKIIRIMKYYNKEIANDKMKRRQYI